MALARLGKSTMAAPRPAATQLSVPQGSGPVDTQRAGAAAANRHLDAGGAAAPALIETAQALGLEGCAANNHPPHLALLHKLRYAQRTY